MVPKTEITCKLLINLIFSRDLLTSTHEWIPFQDSADMTVESSTFSLELAGDIQNIRVHPRSLTARPWRMVGLEDKPASYWVLVTFQGRFLLNFGRVS